MFKTVMYNLTVKAVVCFSVFFYDVVNMDVYLVNKINNNRL